MDVSIKVKTVKPLDENIGEYLCDFRRAKGFLDRSLKAITIKEKHQ